MNQKTIERNSLIVSIIVNIIITCSGIWVFIVTDIQALFLDFFFSFIATLSSVSAVIISKISKRNTKYYPDGIYYLEPLYAILKSLLTLGLLIFSAFTTGVSAYNYFKYNIGEPMNIGPVLPYTILMVILCFTLSFFNSKQNKRINNVSTMLTVESKTNFIDGLQSLGVGVAILILTFVKIDSPFGFLYYTGDFFITITLVLLSLKQPIIVIISSFRELSGGITSNEVIKDTISKIVQTHLNGVIKDATCDIFKIGMHIKVRINISTKVKDLTTLTKIRDKILLDLNNTYENIEVIFYL